MKNGVVSPHGIDNQSSTNELVDIIEKNRLTNDKSFEFSEGNSINDMLERDNLPCLRCGKFLPQIMHCDHALRTYLSYEKIVDSKIELKSAHMIDHLHGFRVALKITIVGSVALA